MTVHRAPNRSAGICQSFDDFSKLDDLMYAARTTGLKGNELNFVLLKQGELVRASELHHSVERTHSFNPNVSTGPDMPHPRPQRRDDLELELASKFRPRPY